MKINYIFYSQFTIRNTYLIKRSTHFFINGNICIGQMKNRKNNDSPIEGPKTDKTASVLN